MQCTPLTPSVVVMRLPTLRGIWTAEACLPAFRHPVLLLHLAAFLPLRPYLPQSISDQTLLLLLRPGVFFFHVEFLLPDVHPPARATRPRSTAEGPSSFYACLSVPRRRSGAARRRHLRNFGRHFCRPILRRRNSEDASRIFPSISKSSTSCMGARNHGLMCRKITLLLPFCHAPKLACCLINAEQKDIHPPLFSSLLFVNGFHFRGAKTREAAADAESPSPHVDRSIVK